MAINFEKHAEPVPAGELRRIVAAVAALDVARGKADALEEKLKEAKAEVERLASREIPDMLLSIGLSSVELADGRKVSVGQDIYASITEANAPAAFAWLRKTGNDSIIRHTVGVAFGKGDDKTASRLAEELTKRYGDNLEVIDKEAVHPQTLKAFVRECIADEVPNFPEELFGVRKVNNTTVKERK